MHEPESNLPRLSPDGTRQGLRRALKNISKLLMLIVAGASLGLAPVALASPRLRFTCPQLCRRTIEETRLTMRKLIIGPKSFEYWLANLRPCPMSHVRCESGDVSRAYKFVAVHQEGFISSSPRRLSIRFFSKALVGEHRALSYLYGMAMILTPPCSQTFRSHALHAHSHTNIFEHALLHESHFHCSRGICRFLC